MIERCYLVRSDSVNPYYNLSLEDYLFHHIPEDSLILFLCRNQNTVLIGRSQNAYKECCLNAMEQDHCYLARRSSGGGAVYQDTGCLNFSFLTYMDSYDIRRQLRTVTAALAQFDLDAQASGRNDILIHGRKVSGSAYLTEKEHCLHHGTILWNTDKQKMQRYLNVSRDKIEAKGFDSVVSRVADLTDFDPSIGDGEVIQALINSVADQYGPLSDLAVDADLSPQLEHYHSYNFIYNTLNEYTIIVHDYYSFGEAQLYVDLKQDRVTHVDVFTDALDVDLQQQIEGLFTGLRINDASFAQRLFTRFGPDWHEDMARIYLAIKRYCFPG
jgi:lipoate-protein ligase A